MTHEGRVVIEVPVRLVSIANLREHWSARQRRAREQRGAARRCARSAFARQGRPVLPLKVEIVRRGPRRLDDDNLVTAAKSLRDGLADAFEVDDGDPGLSWTYRQERARRYGVLVLISVAAS